MTRAVDEVVAFLPFNDAARMRALGRERSQFSRIRLEYDAGTLIGQAKSERLPVFEMARACNFKAVAVLNNRDGVSRTAGSGSLTRIGASTTMKQRYTGTSGQKLQERAARKVV